jgi:hypothetical protein
MNHFHLNQKGSIFVLMAFTIPFLFALSAIAVDCGYLYVQRSHMQNIADAAALAGAAKLGENTNTAQELAETYIEKNSNASDAANTNTITFLEENNTKKIRVDITKAAPLLFMKYFNYNTVNLAVHAIASYSGNELGIFDHSIISGGEGTFYLMGEWDSGGNKFNGPIHVNGKFQFDKNSENGYGTDNIPSTGTEINAPITISAEKYDIGGLNKPANQILASKFSYGTDKIDTETNPIVKAKIDSLTNKANTFSDSHPANVWGNIDVAKLTAPLYVNGNFGSGYSAKNIVSGTYNNDVVIVATGDISLNLSAATFSATATITLISLNGNIMISGGNIVNLNALAPNGGITVNGGGTTINGYLIGQSVTLGQGNRTYQNSRWSGGGSSGNSGSSGKVRLIE